jgi:hypothetical protein
LTKPEHLTCGSDHSEGAVVPVPSRAILLCDDKLSRNEQNLAAILDFFGIPWKVLSPAAISGECVRADLQGSCVLSSAPCMATAVENIGGYGGDLPPWVLRVHSVYLYDFQETELCRKLLRLLTNSTEANIRKPLAPEDHFSLTGDFPEMCGPLSGLRVPVGFNEKDFCFDFQPHRDEHQSIIAANSGGIFLSCSRSGVRFFLSASSEIIDIHLPATKYFDVKEHFCSAVPIVMYLTWTFGRDCWTSTQTPGCLIVDDPLLKSRYGFLRFNDALKLMDTHNFTTAIAFIPWNWRRTNRQTVEQFKSRADRLSVCVHGCDHSGGEFAVRSTALLSRRSKTASQRMASLFQRTSLRHDNVMVFPQGMFSPEAGRALKLHGFVAAVNTEVAPSGDARNDTKIADLWNVAIMRYGTFPIFTRRYLTHGVENFAFDALLGKPCLIVAHHEVFRDHGRELAEFIERLNSLKWSLRWCSLGDAISHSFKTRKSTREPSIIQMYANHLLIENSSSEAHEAMVMKEESDPERVKAIKINKKPIDHCYEDGQLQFKLSILPGERCEICVLYSEEPEVNAEGDGLAYRMKIQIRRHLCEFRDNYVSQNDVLLATAAKLRKHFQGAR